MLAPGRRAETDEVDPTQLKGHTKSVGGASQPASPAHMSNSSPHDVTPPIQHYRSRDADTDQDDATCQADG